MKHRPYRDEFDVPLLQKFNGLALSSTDGCGYLHPGDIPHRLFNGNRWHDPAEVMTIWEEDGEVAAWALVGPRHGSFDVQVRPDLRGGLFERDLVAQAEADTRAAMKRHSVDRETLWADTFRCDTARIGIHRQLGWEPSTDPGYMVNRAPLDTIGEASPADGYSIRSVTGVAEAAALAEVHSASFGSSWTPELYRRVMTSPGYDPQRELVAVAPDGSLAGFIVTWHDPISRTGLFEPVGTHRDHRRRGVARALVLEGMRRMKEAGLGHAYVVNAVANEPSAALYTACGFVPLHLIDGFTKPV